MISLNINESKKLRFKISLSGVQPQDLQGAMRIISEKVEYGFPIKIDNGDVVVEVGPLADIYPDKVKDNIILDSKLEIIADSTYLVPWSGKISLKNPIKVEASIDDIEVEELSELLLPEIKVSNVSEEEEKKKKEKKIDESSKKEDKKKSRFSMMMEQDKKKCPEGEKY